MHQFPPPIWMTQDWTAGRLIIIAVFGLIVPLIVARLTKPSSIMTTIWVVVGVMSLCAFGAYHSWGRMTYEPYQYMMALPALLVVVSSGVLIRTWWKHQEAIGRIHEGIAILLIIFVVVSIALPGVSTPPEVYRRSQCRNNLKQIGLGLHNYLDEWQRFPPASLGPTEVSWRINLLPFIEHAELAQKYDRSKRWDDALNAQLQTIRVPPYACPTRPNSFTSNGQFLTSYVAPTIQRALFAAQDGASIVDIADGTSNTLMIMEACGTSIVWTSPVDTVLPAIEVSVNQPGIAPGLSNSMTSSWHFNGSQILLADGSVRFVTMKTDPKVLEAIMTRNGGESLEDLVIGDWGTGDWGMTTRIVAAVSECPNSGTCGRIIRLASHSFGALGRLGCSAAAILLS